MLLLLVGSHDMLFGINKAHGKAFDALPFFELATDDGLTPAFFDSISTSSVASSKNGSARSEEHTSELQSHSDLVCRLLLEKKKKTVRECIGLGRRASVSGMRRGRGNAFTWGCVCREVVACMYRGVRVWAYEDVVSM